MGRVSLEDPRRLSSVDAAQRAALLDGFRQTLQGSQPQAVAGADWSDPCLMWSHQLGSTLRLLQQLMDSSIGSLLISKEARQLGSTLGQVILATERCHLGAWTE